MYVYSDTNCRISYLSRWEKNFLKMLQNYCDSNNAQKDGLKKFAYKTAKNTNH